MKLKERFWPFLVLGLSLFVCFTLILPKPIFGDEVSDTANNIADEIKQLENELSKIGQKIGTLKGELVYMDSQIQLTELKISQTVNQVGIIEAQIEELAQKLGVLDISLNETAALFINRVVATYKVGKMSSLDVLLSSDSFSDFFRRARYLKAAQNHDRQLMVLMEEVRVNYDRQKQEKEEKQQELTALKLTLDRQKVNLDQQKASKNQLLAVTKNDEKVYQGLLDQARAEYQAIQAIMAGNGDEEEAGQVSKGERIASVIVGNSCNSSGTHLHFTIANDSGSLNPFNYLKSVDHNNCSGGGTCSAADPFNPSGGWDWPLDPVITMSQGYGSTWAINNTWVGRVYNFHNGIDIIGVSATIKAVADGTLYRGSYGGSGGCRLRYVRLDHSDSDLETYYLHINY